MIEKAYQSFTELAVWKKARVLKIEISALVKNFPAEEKYRLCDQLIRSSRSITSSIAEGHGRFTFKDQLHFCIIARGSLSETCSHLIDAFDEKYLTREKLVELKKQIEEIAGLLNSYISHLRRNIK